MSAYVSLCGVVIFSGSDKSSVQCNGLAVVAQHLTRPKTAKIASYRVVNDVAASSFMRCMYNHHSRDCLASIFIDMQLAT